MTRTLYELDRIESPFVWRAKYALAHKGLAYEPNRLGFTQIPNTCDGRHETVPFLVDENGAETCDSADIAAYLDTAYPDAPALLSNGSAERAAEIDAIMNTVVFPAVFPLYIRDVWALLDGEDADYFRSTREARFGTTLEQMSADRDARLPDARAAIEPLRTALGTGPWFHGEAPGYGDYIVLAFFAWIKAVASAPPLAAGDPLADYVTRGLALFDGIGADLPGTLT